MGEYDKFFEFENRIYINDLYDVVITNRGDNGISGEALKQAILEKFKDEIKRDN